ncbi:muscarinic acetylcholine receptor M2-like [Diadema setosum]|uniref:muscarinic acetylcholine receptor M2-like n=1 Tax=Diadema setosum TaxID=31175 RepID=UPI003B3B33E8
MTLADLVVGAVIMPLRSSIELYGTWIFGRIFGVLFMTLQNASLGISVMGVVVITIDRYIATLHPLTHFTKKSRRMAIIINVLTWVLPFMLWFFLNAVWDFVDPNGIDGLFGIPVPNYTVFLASSSIVFCLRFWGPLMVIMTLYLRIYFHIRTRLRKRRPRSTERSRPDNYTKSISSELADHADIIRTESRLTSSKEREIRPVERCSSSFEPPSQISIVHFDNNDKNIENESHRNDTKRVKLISSIFGENSQCPALQGELTGKNLKAIRTLSFVVLVFAMTWFPNGVNLMIYSISLSSSISPSDVIADIARWITYSNSLLNPAAYALAQPLIRRTLTLLLGRIFR